MKRRLIAFLLAIATMALLPGCAAFTESAPSCGDPLKLAIVAQSVAGASYVPCVGELPQGWSTSGFDPARGRTVFLLDSDRSPGRPVTVRLTSSCTVSNATPSPARAVGVLTYTRLNSIAPRFTGILYDVFPGGCVSYAFDFARGAHITLMEQFAAAIGLYPRQQLRLAVKQKLGVELDP